MKTIAIKTILKDYHDNKGLIERLFGDHKDIQRLDKFALKIRGDNRELSPTELYELSSILLNEDTGIGTDERTVMKELRKELFGITGAFDYINRHTYRAAIDVLWTKSELCSEHIIKDMFKHVHSIDTAKAIVALKQNDLLTEENLLLCLKAKKPSQCAEAFQVLSNHNLLTSKNKKRIQPYSGQIDNLKYLLDLLKNLRMQQLGGILFENPKIISSVSDFLKKLSAISPSLLSIENIRAVIVIASNKTKVENIERAFARIYRIFSFYLQKSVCGKFSERVILEKRDSQTYKSDHYEMKIVADLRTDENLKKLLQREKHLDSTVVSEFLYMYKTESLTDQTSAQHAFDKMIAQLDSSKKIKPINVDYKFFSQCSLKGLPVPTSSVIAQQSSSTPTNRRLPSR